MQKKYLPILVIAIFCIIVCIVSIYYFTIPSQNNTGTTPNTNNTTNNIPSQENDTNLNLPTEGNDTIIHLKSDTTLRVVNDYDEKFFTSKKNLLIMFASWCPNCQEEIGEIEKILNYYKNNSNVNVILIAHEYNDTVNNLISLLENDVDFGNAEVKLDLKRIIRKTIDPKASTIPISYVVDNKGNVLDVFNDSLTLEKAIEMLKK